MVADKLESPPYIDLNQRFSSLAMVYREKKENRLQPVVFIISNCIGIPHSCLRMQLACQWQFIDVFVQCFCAKARPCLVSVFEACLDTSTLHSVSLLF